MTSSTPTLGDREKSTGAGKLAAPNAADAAALDEAARIALAGPTADDVRSGLGALAARLADRETAALR